MAATQPSRVPYISQELLILTLGQCDTSERYGTIKSKADPRHEHAHIVCVLFASFVDGYVLEYRYGQGSRRSGIEGEVVTKYRVLSDAGDVEGVIDGRYGGGEGMAMVIKGKGEDHRTEAEVVSSSVTTRRSTSSNMSIVDLDALCPAQTGVGYWRFKMDATWSMAYVSRGDDVGVTG
ncbi:hypothetical protein DFP72DRAFT_1049333 [Ephemerocybe angulata]|uniref:Uncharacterized protein n=1 Tax=Ephemerocybe angulata TaxID=980116 RepID=A0A8H6M1F5_9AGAR|nr:hypothetical protein DFP72DRAFT_1049333 [Tulosesus angulatus]